MTRALPAYGLTSIGAWGSAGLQFAAGVILARSLSPRELGAFVFASAIALFVFGVLDLRVEEGLTQFFIRERQAGREGSVVPALRYGVAIDVVSGALILGAMLATLAAASAHLGRTTEVVVAVIALASFIGVADGSFIAILYAQQAFGWIAGYQIVANGGRCLALLALPLDQPTDAAWATVTAQAATTAFVIFVVVARFLPHHVRSESLEPAVRRLLLRFSLHVAAASALSTIRATALPLVLGAVGTLREVAAARVAEGPTRLLGVGAAPMRTVLFPRLSGAWARRDLRGGRQLVRQYLVSTALLVGVLGAVLALTIGSLLPRIYGPAYEGLERVGQLFVLAALLDALAGWQKVAPAALDRPWLRTYILLAESCVLFAALLLLVPGEGATGAAVSAVLAGAVSLLVGAYWLRPAFAERVWTGERAGSGSEKGGLV